MGISLTVGCSIIKCKDKAVGCQLCIAIQICLVSVMPNIKIVFKISIYLYIYKGGCIGN